MGGEEEEVWEEGGGEEGEEGIPRDIEEHGVAVAVASDSRVDLLLSPGDGPSYLFIYLSRCYPRFWVVDRTVVLWNRR